MALNRKETAWRKNRRFGEIHGGRSKRKVPDSILRRVHSLPPPADGAELPQFIIDNPSRQFAFPIVESQIRKALGRLPYSDTARITHVWLRRVSMASYRAGRVPFAQFLCGRGARIIVLYPWPTDMLLRFGRRRPMARLLREYSPWTEDLVLVEERWCLRWTMDALRAFYLNHLLLHEVGHHVDWYYRRWTEANRRQTEEAADQYAVYWSKRAPKQYHDRT